MSDIRHDQTPDDVSKLDVTTIYRGLLKIAAMPNGQAILDGLVTSALKVTQAGIDTDRYTSYRVEYWEDPEMNPYVIGYPGNMNAQDERKSSAGWEAFLTFGGELLNQRPGLPFANLPDEVAAD